MRMIFPVALVVVGLGFSAASAQPGYELPIAKASGPSRPLEDPKPVYKYELKPEHGPFVVSVKTFRGAKPGDRQCKELAEGLAEYIRSECRLYAYVYETGWNMRQERAKEKAQVLANMEKYYKEKGLEITPELMKIKMARIPDEYTVLVAPGKGELKTLDDALEFAKYVRKLKAPPADFCDGVIVGSDSDIAKGGGEKINPFLTVFAGRNPSLPKPAAGTLQKPKADEFLMNLNASKPHSLIHKTKKEFTLVLQSYGSKFGTVMKPGEATNTTRKADGELLERAAQQAQQIVGVLRGMNYDAYVLHTRFESFVCVGEYDTKDDAKLLANAQALAGELKDKKTGNVIATFMEKPLPAMIPRP